MQVGEEVAKLRGRPLRLRDVIQDQNDAKGLPTGGDDLALVLRELVGIQFDIVACSLLRGRKHRRERVNGVDRATEREAEQ